MRRYLNLDTRDLQEKSDYAVAVINLAGTRGDTPVLDVQFVRGGIAQEIDLPTAFTTLKFGGKLKAREGGDYVVSNWDGSAFAYTKLNGSTFTDGVTNTDTSLASATVAFNAADVGLLVTGTGIPADTTITAVAPDGSAATLSAATTATATGVTIVISGRVTSYRLFPNFKSQALHDAFIDGTIGERAADQAARYALTDKAVGYIVAQDDNSTYWQVIDADNLGNSAGWSIAPEKEYIDLDGEIEWTIGSQVTSSRVFLLHISNDVNRGTEGVSPDANPAYPLPDEILTRELSPAMFTRGMDLDPVAIIGPGTAQTQELKWQPHPTDSSLLLGYYTAWAAFDGSGSTLRRVTADKSRPDVLLSDDLVLSLSDSTVVATGLTYLRLGGWAWEGTYHFYLSGGGDGVWHAHSTDGFAITCDVAPVLTGAGQGHDLGNPVGLMSVVKKSGTIYGVFNTTNQPLLFLATSTNWTTWTKVSADPFLWPTIDADDGGIEHNDLVVVGDYLVVIYEAYSGTHWSACLAYTLDPLASEWPKLPQPVIERSAASAFAQQHIATPTLCQVGNTWLASFQGSNVAGTGGGSQWSLGMAFLRALGELPVTFNAIAGDPAQNASLATLLATLEPKGRAAGMIDYSGYTTDNEPPVGNITLYSGVGFNISATDAMSADQTATIGALKGGDSFTLTDLDGPTVLGTWTLDSDASLVVAGGGNYYIIAVTDTGSLPDLSGRSLTLAGAFGSFVTKIARDIYGNVSCATAGDVFVLTPLNSAPANPVVGSVCLDTTTSPPTITFWDGTTWRVVTSV